MDRKDAETRGWQFVAEQEGYARAERLLASGELINCGGETVAQVLAAIDAWENYPVQAPNTRTNDLVEPEGVAEVPNPDEVTA